MTDEPKVDLDPERVAQELRNMEANRASEQAKMMADIKQMKEADEAKRPELLNVKPPPGWPPGGAPQGRAIPPPAPPRK